MKVNLAYAPLGSVGGGLVGCGAVRVARDLDYGWLVLILGVVLLLGWFAPLVVIDIRLGREIKRLEGKS